MVRAIAHLVWPALLAGCNTPNPEFRLDWSDGPALPEAVSGHGFARHGDDIVVVGGTAERNGTTVAIDSVRRFDPAAGAWTEWPSLPKPLAHPACVTVADELWVIGGATGDRTAAECWRLAAGSESPVWQTLPSLPDPRAGASAVLIDKTVWLVCGAERIGDADVAAEGVLRFDLENPGAGWITSGKFPGAARQFAAVCAVGDRLYVFGGIQADKSGKRHVFKDSYRYSPRRDEWVRLADLPEGFYAAAAVGLDERYLLLFGGATADNLGDDQAAADRPCRHSVHLYDTLTDRFHLTDALLSGVGSTAAVGLDDRVVILGGETSRDRRTDAVQIGALRLVGLGWYR